MVGSKAQAHVSGPSLPQRSMVATGIVWDWTYHALAVAVRHDYKLRVVELDTCICGCIVSAVAELY